MGRPNHIIPRRTAQRAHDLEATERKQRMPVADCHEARIAETAKLARNVP